MGLAYPDGLIQLQDGGTLEARSVVIPASEEFEWTGGTLRLERFEGLLINEGGTLAPGTPIGTTAVTGGYIQFPDAVLEIELGPVGTSHDMVTVTHRATLFGQLKLGLLTGFTATPQQTFTIFQAGIESGNLTANFSNIANGQRLETADGLGSFLVHFGAGSAFNPNHIVLSNFMASLPGDLNGDGFVGIADLNLVLSNWNQNVPPANLLADPSGDGFVGIADLNLVLGNWNAGTPPGAGANIPEPGTLAMFGLIVGSCTLCRKRRCG